MNSRQVSKCPYCRRELFHFPAVCEALHVYLKITFPEEYAGREAATRGEAQKTQPGHPICSLK